MTPAEPIFLGLTAKQLVLAALVAVSLNYIVAWFRIARHRDHQGLNLPKPIHALIGLIANFFDTLGIGSFATTTAMVRATSRDVDDRELPGTLNVGHALPTVTQALIYIAIIEVDMLTLVALIAASVAGMWLGAGVVSRFSKRKVQIGMGIALIVAAGLMLKTIFEADAAAVGTLGLTGALLLAGIIGNFGLGMLMALGIGLYGPCLIMISLLGMNPKAAFPIMMGSCAFLMPTGSIKFIKTGAYNFRAALGFTLGGIPGTLVAALIVREMDLEYVRWLVIVVVLYTATSLLMAARREKALA